MIVLGIDPGFERCGAAVVDISEGIGEERVIFSTSVRTSSKDTFDKRLLSLGEKIGKIIDAHSPDVLSIESLFFSKNKKTAMSVSEARGVVVFQAAKRGLEVHEFRPAEIKIAVTGHGGSDKKQVEDMVKRLVSFPKENALDDEVDAVAVALTYSAHRGLNRASD